jgi:hypothetical protein
MDRLRYPKDQPEDSSAFTCPNRRKSRVFENFPRTQVWRPSLRWLCSMIAVRCSRLGRLTGNPHLTLVSVGCCSRARVCLDRRSETQIF